jgi:hypothetical protein
MFPLNWRDVTTGVLAFVIMSLAAGAGMGEFGKEGGDGGGGHAPPGGGTISGSPPRAASASVIEDSRSPWRAAAAAGGGVLLVPLFSIVGAFNFVEVS